MTSILILKTVPLPPATLRAMQAILGQHGVRIEMHEEATRATSLCLLLLPVGSHKERDGFLLHREHNRIILPDGFIFYQTLDSKGWSSIRFPRHQKPAQEPPDP